ncbi:EAL domain-containing protein [Methylococcus capsulatus]|uniref:cyclic-guanylate-specific phosphodiesterase n=1 Tax=Methylococcus capsulatus TaxID=414 RepID=A0AA35UFD9_METCP|nr:EAL domain-containing protein [Methylococcus capsulatus]CAI8718841.1 diguanylate cyclase [Methylococcus capsulatus]
MATIRKAASKSRKFVPTPKMDRTVADSPGEGAKISPPRHDGWGHEDKNQSMPDPRGFRKPEVRGQSENRNKRVTLIIILGKYLWIAGILASVVMSEVVTAAMGLLLKGEVTYDYLATGMVAALLVSGIVVAGTMKFEELERRRQEEVAKNRALRASERRYRTLIEVASDAILVTDSETGTLVDCNRQAETLLGMSRNEIIGRHLCNLQQTGNDADGAETDLLGHMLQGKTGTIELSLVRADGTTVPVEVSSSTFEMDGRRYVHGAFRDITQRREAEDRIKHLAHHDPLTNLPNRVFLHGRLEQAIELARREQNQVAVMFIDLDNFKRINDTLGHRIGDALLEQVAARLTENVPGSQVVGRLGGDEFIVVITGNRVSTTSAAMAERILESLCRPYTVEDYQLHSGASIGIAIYPADGNSAETLMKHADAAMYHAKSRGRNTFEFFSQAINRGVRERLDIENGLRDALKHGGFKLHYQPQIDLTTGSICSVEALLRWRHPLLGVIAPDRFIPIAEETKLILPLGLWVIDRACHQLRAWRNDGITGVRMAINVSVKQLQDESFFEALGSIVERHGLSGSDIELEITESAIMENLSRVQALLKSLQDYGITLSIDDFGTGYSSLGRLKLLPIQSLKIDRSFVHDIETDHGNAKICDGIIALGHSLGLKIIAEGVETDAQKNLLQNSGCDAIQGFLIAKPLPADDVAKLITQVNGMT